MDYLVWVLGVRKINICVCIMWCIIFGCCVCYVNMGGCLIVCIDIFVNINLYFIDWLIIIYVNEEL